jgi:hypothetical protein
MLGRYVPRLEFLAVILGDEPALDANVSFYQRLLARDQDEAEDLVREHLNSGSAEGVYDEMLIPTLQATKVSRGRGDIAEADERFVLRAIREIIEDLGQKLETSGSDRPDTEEPPEGGGAGTKRAIRILGYPAHDLEDATTLEMLQNLLDPKYWELGMLAPETLTAELLEQVAEQQPALLCLVATPPGGMAHTRYLCKRLRARFPDLKILVCRWTGDSASQNSSKHLHDAGADFVTATLLETRQQLTSLHPVLAQTQNDHDRASEGPDSALGSRAASRAKKRPRASDRDAVVAAASS